MRGEGRANCWISLVACVSKCTGVGVMHAWCYTCAEYLHARPRAFQVLREAWHASGAGALCCCARCDHSMKTRSL